MPYPRSSFHRISHYFEMIYPKYRDKYIMPFFHQISVTAVMVVTAILGYPPVTVIDA